MELFDGDHEKVKKLNELVCTSLGFDKWVPVSGQTYSRKIDYRVLSALSSIAQSANKMAGDIRLLASMKQVFFIDDLLVVVISFQRLKNHLVRIRLAQVRWHTSEIQ